MHRSFCYYHFIMLFYFYLKQGLLCLLGWPQTECILKDGLPYLFFVRIRDLCLHIQLQRT